MELSPVVNIIRKIWHVQNAGGKPPAPIRGHIGGGGSGGGGGADADDDDDEAEEGDDDAGVNVADLVPRNDIRSSSI